MNSTARRAWPEIGAVLVGFCWSWLWVQGLPFFADDYAHWLAGAQATPWPAAIAAVFDPWGGDDPSWGFKYRPVITLWFKALHGLHGASPGAFFVWKSLAAAALVALAVGLARRALGGAIAAAVVALLLLGSHGFVASLVWHGDLAVVADLLILATIALVARDVALQPDASEPWWRAGARRVLPFVVGLLAMQTKGNAKMLPAILVVGMVFGGRAAARRIAPLAAALLLVAVPVKAIVAGHAAPFHPVSGVTGQSNTWRAASFDQVRALVLDDAAKIVRAPEMVSRSLVAALFPLGWAIAAVAIGAAVIAARRPRAPAVPSTDAFGRHALHLVAGWAAFALASTAVYPDLNPAFEHRFGIDFLVPWALVLGWAAAATLRRIREPGAGRAAIAILSAAGAVQLWSGLHRAATIRASIGGVEIIAARVNAALAAAPDLGQRVYLNYIPYEHWPLLGGREIVESRPEALLDMPVGTYVATWDVPLVPDYQIVLIASPDAGTLFDAVVKPNPIETAVLLRRLPPSDASLAGRRAADIGDWATAAAQLSVAVRERDFVYDRCLLALALLQLDRPAEAVEVMADLLARGPRGLRAPRYNHALALHRAYRFEDAVREYQRILLEYPGDVQVLYNLGVSQRSAGRTGEAVRTFHEVLARDPTVAGARANLAELSAPGGGSQPGALLR